MICEILAVSAENTRNELSQKPAAITNRLSTVATKLFGFILIFCEKSSPKCLLACCPVLLVTTAKTGSIERGRFTELGPWSAYDGDWVGAALALGVLEDMLELLVPDEPPAEELDAKPEYCGFQRFTANWCAADTDRTLGRGSWGKVLAVRWQMGELDKNFITMQTSSGEELNIIGERCIAELLGGWGSKSSWLGV